MRYRANSARGAEFVKAKARGAFARCVFRGTVFSGETYGSMVGMAIHRFRGACSIACV